MAERRMFAKALIDSDLFLDLPLSAQSLYFHLSLRADDDGFVGNPRKIQRMVGSNDDDMKLLVLKQFILVFESGVIVIRHWRLHNYIRNDRYKETIYTEEKAQISVGKDNLYTVGIPSDSQTVGNLATQYRVGKDSKELEEDRGESTLTPSPTLLTKKSSQKAERHKYGEYNHVLLTDEQLKKLNEDFGNNTVDTYIRKVNEYCQQTGKAYRDYNLTIRNWVQKDKQNNGGIHNGQIERNGDFKTSAGDSPKPKYGTMF